MKRWMLCFLLLALALIVVACKSESGLQEPEISANPSYASLFQNAETENKKEICAEVEHLELPLSDMTVKITSQGKIAVFQLYDTEAAIKFYEQLPLNLELSNFRDAQWMFYPPEKLPVTDEEAYHDGKQGELSYYEPWGDVFMLYEDFYAGDEMHRLGVGLTGIENIAEMSGNALIEKVEETVQEEEEKLKLQIGDRTFTATLEDNSSVDALKELLADGPLTLDMSDYASMEKGADLGTVLPQNNVSMNTEAGDIVLYQGRTFVIYYDTNSWSLTPIGKIDDVNETELRQILGTGNITVIISID